MNLIWSHLYGRCLRLLVSASPRLAIVVIYIHRMRWKLAKEKNAFLRKNVNALARSIVDTKPIYISINNAQRNDIIIVSAPIHIAARPSNLDLMKDEHTHTQIYTRPYIWNMHFSKHLQTNYRFLPTTSSFIQQAIPRNLNAHNCTTFNRIFVCFFFLSVASFVPCVLNSQFTFFRCCFIIQPEIGINLYM